ncbi:MAG: hypothetical protein GZ091_08390 [Paludibacter sp.]|nr:hypothetical protein [Paludibacter sp.]
MNTNSSIFYIMSNKSLSIFVIIILFGSLILLSCKEPIVQIEKPKPSTVIKLDSFGVHPRLIMSNQDISQMRENINSGNEPWNSTWIEFKKTVDLYLSPSWKTDVYTGSDVSAFYNNTIRDASAARDLALAYQITKDKKYAEMSVLIIETWLAPEILPASYFDPEIAYPNMGMMVARSTFPFLYAYDLLMADKLVSEKTQKRFAEWMRICEMRIKEGAKRWEDSNYFDNQFYQNHLVADAMGLLGIGIVLNDSKLAQYAFNSVENQRDAIDLIEGMILMKGQQPYYREPKEMPTQTGEIMDRYRHYAIGGHWKDYVTYPNRGLQYCGLSSILLMICAEMARNNGVDLYNWTAKTGENLKLPLDFYADFYITKDASINGGFYAGEDSWINGNDQTTYSLWEVGHCRYPGEKKFAEVLNANKRGSQGMHLLGPVTLTHGRKVE